MACNNAAVVIRPTIRMAYKWIRSGEPQSFNRIYGLQREINGRQQRMGSNSQPVILLLEHLPTYTAGRRIRNTVEGERSPDLLVDPNELRKRGADIEYIDRGGQWTFHGPGQLVAYPLVNLNHHFIPATSSHNDAIRNNGGSSLSVRCYVHSLEQVMIETCQQFGIQHVGRRVSGAETGVWVNDTNGNGQAKKIGAIGIQINRYCAMHGLALNCNTDLSWFSAIVPCGIKDLGVTSISKELDRIVTASDAVPAMVKSFEQVWNGEIQELSQINPRLDSEIDSLLS